MSKIGHDTYQEEINLLNIFNGIALGFIFIMGFPIFRSTSQSSLLSALVGCLGFVVNAVLAFRTKSSKDRRFYQMAVVWSFVLPIVGIYLFFKYFWQ